MEDTPTPTPSETPTPTATPVGQVVYTVVPPGYESGVEVVFRYEVTAGDLLISSLLFGVFTLILLSMVWTLWRGQDNR